MVGTRSKRKVTAVQDVDESSPVTDAKAVKKQKLAATSHESLIAASVAEYDNDTAEEAERVGSMLVSIPDDLPGREEEFSTLYSHLFNAVDQKTDVSGVPGTGKTATLRSVIKTMRQNVDEESLEDFDYFEINCMKLLEPAQAYAELWKCIAPRSPKVSSKKAAELLSKYFKRKKKSKLQSDADDRKPIILLLDELDMLVTKKQEVIYNFFHWPREALSNLIVVGIANTMDLPERVFLQKINSRVGKRVVFKAYTVEQLSNIIGSRTGGSVLFQKDAIEFCARKVAGISGDARRALDICQHALETFTLELKNGGTQTRITREFITKVIKEMFFSPQMRAVQSAAFYEQMFLVAFCCLVKRTKLQEFTLDEMILEMRGLCHLLDERVLSGFEVSTICSRLFCSKFILVQPGKQSEGNNRIRLNMAEADIMLALRLNKDETFLRVLDP
ncbi:Origin recognition complex, subunit 1 [Dinochytrium kinnereticum]|nr:Origin recognition complex, subunit 1 [Dinochytrium kinnereticum]